ncbi:MAG: hypothetical protein WD249_13005 [Gaiellaceae bacterium]
MRPWIRTALGLAALALASAAIAATPIYEGSAKGLVLTAGEAKYERITKSRATRPSAGKRPGIKSAWNATYQDENFLSISSADLTIYVYATAQHALRAYRDACKTGCSAEKRAGQVRFKTSSLTHEGLPVAVRVSTCRNLYVAAIASATDETRAQLAFNARYLVGAVYKKAAQVGMGPC